LQQPAFAICSCSNIFVASFLVSNARYCAAIFSISVSAFVPPVYSHMNTASSPIIYPQFHSPCINLTSNFLLLGFVCLPFLCHCCLFGSIHLLTRKEWTRGPWTPLVVKGLVWFTNGSKTAEGNGAGFYEQYLGRRLSIPLGKCATVFQAKVYAILACVYEI
jgi:hypothetical protein